jgi:protein TonB
MHKALSSLLIALSVYLLVILAVLYAYTHYRSNLSESATKTPSIISVDVIGASGQVSKPQPLSPKKPMVVKEEKSKPSETKVPLLIKQKKLPVEKTTEKAKNIPKKPTQKPKPAMQSREPIVEKSPAPIMPTPVIIHQDPSKILDLKSIPQPTPVAITQPNIDPALMLSLKKVPTSRPKTDTKHKERVRKQKKQSKSSKHQAQRKKSHRGSGASTKRSTNSKSRNRFIANLKARINRNKSYPRIAQRRGVTGTVRVGFTILRSGGVGHISVHGPKLFHASAKTAVSRAFPINPSKTPFALPRRMTLMIRYK